MPVSYTHLVYFYKISGGFDQDGEFVEGLTVDRIDVYGSQFGYGRIQGIELPLEAEGNLPTRAWKRQTQGEPWSTGDDYNLGIGQGFMTATPLQQAQMASVIANGGYLYRPSIIHHMTDADGNVVIVDDNSQIVARVHVDRNGQTIITDAEGNVITDPAFSVQFDAEGNPIFQPEVIDTLAVDRQYIQVVQEGMELSLIHIFFSLDIGIDLGTANTLVAVRDKGIVINEPSWVAINKRTRRPLAIGAEAREMVGRTPGDIVAIRPLRDGVISEFEITEAMLKYFIDKAHEQMLVPFPRPRVVVGVPSGVIIVVR